LPNGLKNNLTKFKRLICRFKPNDYLSISITYLFENNKTNTVILFSSFIIDT